MRELSSFFVFHPGSASIIHRYHYHLVSLVGVLLLTWVFPSTAKAGTPVLFSGIDLLTIDLGSRMVSNAETSSDRLNYYAAVGIDPFKH